MSVFVNMDDRNAIHNEMPWEQRDVPSTLYQLIANAKAKYGARPAVSYQLTSGPTDPAETLTWAELHDGACQAANLFRSLGVGE